MCFHSTSMCLCHTSHSVWIECEQDYDFECSVSFTGEFHAEFVHALQASHSQTANASRPHTHDKDLLVKTTRRASYPWLYCKNSSSCVLQQIKGLVLISHSDRCLWTQQTHAWIFELSHEVQICHDNSQSVCHGNDNVVCLVMAE